MSDDRLWLDPRDAGVWRPERAAELRRARRGGRAAVVIAVTMVVATVLVAAAEGLPVRDTDGIFGARLGILAGTLAAFFAIDLVPRAIARARRDGTGVRTAARATVRERWTRRRFGVVAAGLVAFWVTYACYRNLKSYLPFLVEQDGDRALLDLERGLFGADPAALLHDLLGTGAAAHVLSAAYLFFLAFIPISLGAALVLAINPVPGLLWVTALAINWPLGIVTYLLVPALGPAFVTPELFSGLSPTGVTQLQETLLDERRAVLADPFGDTPVQSIAAFASLHVSIVFTAALVGQVVRIPRALRIALWAFLALTLLSTVYFGWHYVVDDVAGLAMGALAVWVAAALTGHRQALPALNLPNAITLARLLAVPVVVAVVLRSRDGSLLAAALFGVLAATDSLDGHLARTRGAVTTLGKVLDPLADKILVASVLAALAALGRLAAWVVAVVVVREVAVTLMRAAAARRAIVVPASTLGKAKMAAQVMLVLAVLLAPDPDAAWVHAVVLTAVALTVASALDYALHLRARSDVRPLGAAG